MSAVVRVLPLFAVDREVYLERLRVADLVARHEPGTQSAQT
jgi:hypothetical protein